MVGRSKPDPIRGNADDCHDAAQEQRDANYQMSKQNRVELGRLVLGAATYEWDSSGVHCILDVLPTHSNDIRLTDRGD
jgi:hypothetical protein